jgi:asparagine synthase (glutamine-hydrolysing)
MCGIAGIIDLIGKRAVPAGVLEAMAQAIVHRGPDEDGFLERPGLGLVSRRLSIVGLSDGRQPISNEDQSIQVVFNGELFDFPERRAELEGRGHRFRTHCDTELIPHFWEENQEDALARLRGQFALAVWDEKRQRLTLARDRFGICPLYWARASGYQRDWLLFASEIKALLASGLVQPRPNPRGINHIFTFFALPGPVTCFEGVEALLPGQYLTIQHDRDGKPAEIRKRVFWEMDFPDEGQEDSERVARELVDQFEAVLQRAVERRLRADVPVVSYLSGGVDSSIVVALAKKIRGESIPTFTIKVEDPNLDETREADIVARHVGSCPVVVRYGPQEVLNTYPRLIWAAEGPVVDTACAALLLLAQEVHRQGYKVALTGEGSDEWLAGYPWFKVQRLFDLMDFIPGLGLSAGVRKAYLQLTGAPKVPWETVRRNEIAAGGPNAWLNIYGLMSFNKLRFYNPSFAEGLEDHSPYADLEPNLERMRRWHPFNRSLYWGARLQLAGLLLNAKGDRVAMHSSVETRYPFLDEEVFAFLAGLKPSWKMRGFRDKYILRLLSERWLPKEIAWRKKAMFRAPFDSFHMKTVPAFIDQLLSEESLRKTGYFDPQAVHHWREAFRTLRPGSPQRASIEMGLVGVISTQLWYQTFIDASLADVPVAGEIKTPGTAVAKHHVAEAARARGNGVHARSQQGSPVGR